MEKILIGLIAVFSLQCYSRQIPLPRNVRLCRFPDIASKELNPGEQIGFEFYCKIGALTDDPPKWENLYSKKGYQINKQPPGSFTIDTRYGSIFSFYFSKNQMYWELLADSGSDGKRWYSVRVQHSRLKGGPEPWTVGWGGGPLRERPDIEYIKRILPPNVIIPGLPRPPASLPSSQP